MYFLTLIRLKDSLFLISTCLSPVVSKLLSFQHRLDLMTHWILRTSLPNVLLIQLYVNSGVKKTSLEFYITSLPQYRSRLSNVFMTTNSKDSVIQIELRIFTTRQ